MIDFNVKSLWCYWPWGHRCDIMPSSWVHQHTYIKTEMSWISFHYVRWKISYSWYISELSVMCGSMSSLVSFMNELRKISFIWHPFYEVVQISVWHQGKNVHSMRLIWCHHGLTWHHFPAGLLHCIIRQTEELRQSKVKTLEDRYIHNMIYTFRSCLGQNLIRIT